MTNIPIPDGFHKEGGKLICFQHGNILTIDTYSMWDIEYTRIHLFAQRPVIEYLPQRKNYPNERSVAEEPINLLSAIDGRFKLKGEIEVQKSGETIYYEQVGVEKNVDYLNYVVKILVNLVDDYVDLLNNGAENIPLLQGIAAQDNNEGLRNTIYKMVKDIGDDSMVKWQDKHPYLLCPTCFVYGFMYQSKIPGYESVTYFGCRNCSQSLDFLERPGRIIAVLNSGMDQEREQTENRLKINWLRHRKLFDFDEVEIVEATDENVERFAVQVGNDTDVVRKPCYEQMSCKVWKGCKLSQNTIRVLKRIFGNVELYETYL